MGHLSRTRAGAGAAAGPPRGSDHVARRRRRIATAGLALTGLAAGALVTVSGAAQAGTPPPGPGNIEIFNKRSMVALEGYAAYAGAEVDIELLRDGVLVSSAHGTLDDTGFFEVNHPGGGCWIGVTPTIRPGDEVKVKIAGQSWTDSAITASPTVTEVAGSGFAPSGEVQPGDPVNRVRGTGTVTIRGTYDPADPWFDPTRFTIETVNPENDDDKTPPGEDPGLSDNRAMGISLVPDAEHPNGEPGLWDASATADPATGEIVGTYTLYTEADYDRVLEGDHVFAAWMAGEEPALGLTQNEFEEIPGPGMGGCPAGPSGTPPTPPSSVGFDSAQGSTEVRVSWATPAQPADVPAPTGYRVSLQHPGNPGQEFSGETGGNSFTLVGLTAGQTYAVEIEATNGTWSEPVDVGPVTVGSGVTSTTPTPPDGTPPPTETDPEAAPTQVQGLTATSTFDTATASWTASPAAETVTGYAATLRTPEGTVVGTQDVTQPTATWSGLPASTAYEVEVVARNANGTSPAATAPVSTKTPAAPSAPTISRTVVQHEALGVEWSPATPGNAESTITAYEITATPSTGEPVRASVAGTALQGTVGGLQNGVAYAVTVTARAAGGLSSTSPAVTAQPAEQVTVDRAQVRVRSTTRVEWKIIGTASDTSLNTITLRTSDGRQIGTAQVQPDGSWSYSGTNAVQPAPDNRGTATTSNGTVRPFSMTRTR